MKIKTYKKFIFEKLDFMPVDYERKTRFNKDIEDMKKLIEKLKNYSHYDELMKLEMKHY